MWDQVVEERRRTGQVQPSGGPVLLLPLYDALMGENWTPQLRLHRTVSRGWGTRQGGTRLDRKWVGSGRRGRNTPGESVCEAFTFELP